MEKKTVPLIIDDASCLETAKNSYNSVTKTHIYFQYAQRTQYVQAIDAIKCLS